MNEPKFQVGDLVRHRASGQMAVVTTVGRSLGSQAWNRVQVSTDVDHYFIEEECIFELAEVPAAPDPSHEPQTPGPGDDVSRAGPQSFQ